MGCGGWPDTAAQSWSRGERRGPTEQGSQLQGLRIDKGQQRVTAPSSAIAALFPRAAVCTTRCGAAIISIIQSARARQTSAGVADPTRDIPRGQPPTAPLSRFRRKRRPAPFAVQADALPRAFRGSGGNAAPPLSRFRRTPFPPRCEATSGFQLLCPRQCLGVGAT